MRYTLNTKTKCEFEMDNKVILRSVAISQGLPYYFTGRPCKHGHIAKRFAVCGKCHECHEEKRKTDHYKAKTKERLVKNADKIRVQQSENMRKWRAENKERDLENGRRYKEKNREKIRARQKELYHADPERHRQYQIKHSQKEGMKEKKKFWFSEWSKKNRHLLKIKEDKRRALEYGAEGNHTHQEAQELLERQKYKCVNCGCCLKKNEKHKDHIVPLSKGGSNYIKNIQWLCKSCNLSKNAKDPIEWAQKNGRLL